LGCVSVLVSLLGLASAFSPNVQVLVVLRGKFCCFFFVKKASRSQRVKESKSQRVKESKSQRVKESKSQRVKESESKKESKKESKSQIENQKVKENQSDTND
jgi:hypothetical protein